MTNAATLTGHVIERYVDVPMTFQRTLDDVYPLPQAITEQLVAVDVGAWKAATFLLADPADQAELQVHVRTLRAQLRAKGYAMAGEYLARAVVIREIRRNGGQMHRSAGAGDPLSLFMGWLDCAERMDASDMHVEINGNMAAIRVRVHGILIPLEDPAAGRYGREEAHDAVAAAFNSTRVGNSGPHYEATKFVNCMVAFNSSRTSGWARFQNLPGRLGPKVVIRVLRTPGEDA